MSEYVLTSEYEFDMSGAAIHMGFTNDQQLYSKVMFVKKAVPLQELSSVVIKKAFGMPQLQCNIYCNKNGKEKTFQIVQFDISSENGKKFLEELKSKISVGCKWTDKMEDAGTDVKDHSAKRVYPLQFWTGMTKTLAGMGRGVQIGVNYGTFCLLILPIPLLIYVLAAGCYRATTDEKGIKVKKLFGSFYSWDDVDHIDVTQYHITITNYGAKAGDAFILILDLATKNGKKKKFMIRTLEGKTFVNEMIERGKMDPRVAELFI
jgi:hypothetical protein